MRELTEQQAQEALALYMHLMEHPEVKSAPVNPGEPMCKICNKTAKEIWEGRQTLSDKFADISEAYVPTDKPYMMLHVEDVKEALKKLLGRERTRLIQSNNSLLTEGLDKDAEEILGGRLI